MNKDLKKVFLVLALYALSGGIFYNFQELWMRDNFLSVKTIGSVYSLCALLTISILFMCSSLVKKERLKDFTLGLLFTNVIVMLLLYLLNGLGFSFIIKFLIMIDYVIDVEVYASIYPMIAHIQKNDKVYAARGIVYSALFYLGSLITIILINKTIIGKITNNSFILIACIILFIAYLVLKKVDLEKYIAQEKDDTLIDNRKFLKSVFKDKVTRNYLIFNLMGNISYYSINGMLLTLLMVGLNKESSQASIFMLVISIISVLLGIFVLKKLTFKNNYINLSIKYLLRTTLYLLAFIFNSNVFFIIAIVYTKVLSDSYSHISDAPYINRFKENEQFNFSNLAEECKYLGRSIGTLICGMAVAYSLRYNFLFAFIFGLIAIIFAYYSLYLRNKEKENK